MWNEICIYRSEFHRREEDIRNPYTDEFEASRRQFAAEKDKRAQLNSQNRSQSLLQMDQRTGYDIITGNSKQMYSSYHTDFSLQGNKKGDKPVESRPQGKKVLGNSISEETVKVGKAALRDTGGRFFLPLGRCVKELIRIRIYFSINSLAFYCLCILILHNMSSIAVVRNTNIGKEFCIMKE